MINRNTIAVLLVLFVLALALPVAATPVQLPCQEPILQMQGAVVVWACVEAEDQCPVVIEPVRTPVEVWCWVVEETMIRTVHRVYMPEARRLPAPDRGVYYDWW